MRRAGKADILLTVGGASVGEHDLVGTALDVEGMRCPAGRSSCGRASRRCSQPGAASLLRLPSNPVSALVCARIFVKPLIDRLLGLSPEHPTVMARLGTAMGANDLRQDYVRATLERQPDGALVASPFAVQDSSMQRTLAEAGCLIIRAPHAPAVGAGSPVEVLPLDF